MKLPVTCRRCGGAAEQPHLSPDDCIRAVDREIRGVLAQLRSLTRRKSALLRARLRSRARVVSARGRRRA